VEGVDLWEEIHQGWPSYDIASHIPTRSVLGRTVGGVSAIKHIPFDKILLFFLHVKTFSSEKDFAGLRMRQIFYDALGLFLLQCTDLGFLYYREGYFLWFSRGTTRIQNG